MNKLFLLFFCLSFLMNPQHAFCQQEAYITGRLIDTFTQEPIPFATIRIKSKAIGLITNFDGGFKIPITYKTQGDILVISCIGYRSKEVILSNLLQSQINQISLTARALELNEVIVTGTKKQKQPKAKEIVRLAINNIEENFPLTPFSYVGYYRDYQIKDTSYLNLNEAVLGIFDAGFHTEDLKSTKTRIYTYRKNQDFRRDTLSSKPYDYQNRSKIIPNATLNGRINNEYTRLRLHDALRNYTIYTYSFIDRLDIDFIKNHTFTLEDDTFFEGVQLYKIKISKNSDKHKIRGHIYISKSNFSIYKLAYAVYEKKSFKHSKKTASTKGTYSKEKGKLGKLLYEIDTEYQNYKGKMYLNYISFSNAFDVLPPPKFAPIAAVIDHDKKRFKLVLNNLPLEKDALKITNYDLYFQERKLRVAKVEVKKNNVFLYPKDADVVFDPKLIQYFKRKTDKGVAIEIKDVSDVYGNIINVSEAINYYQFREFFVQQLSLETKIPVDNLFIKKAIPIYGEQPIAPISNLSEYWMNTPLKN